MVWIPFLALFALACVVMGSVTLSVVMSNTSGYGLDWWRSVWGEFKAFTRVFVFQQPWAFGSPEFLRSPTSTFEANLSQPQPMPVLLVHGFMCNHRLWDRVAAVLVAKGHPVLRVDLEPMFTSIDRFAPLIEDAVVDLCDHTEQKQVALIGHSMGGLAIRAWIRAYGTARVAQVITLGTPHRGTKTIQPMSTPNGQQMAWHSDWLASLAASETQSVRDLITIGLTTQDNIAFPQREQVIPGCRVKVFRAMGHLQMCREERVTTWLLKKLADTPAPPVASNRGSLRSRRGSLR